MTSLSGLPAQPIQFHPPVSSLRWGVRAIGGRFNRARWASVGLTQALFFGLCWLSWNGRPLLSFDFAHQRVHLLGAIYGPQDLLLLAGLLMAGALALFLASALSGRVFCGFVCPQSVYTGVFLGVEQWVMGTPGQRRQRARSGQHLQSAARQALTWGLWGGMSLALGWTFTAYFSSGPDLARRTLAGAMGPVELGACLGYALFAFLQAGLLREKVCQHMCPYARFQGVMGNEHTQVVSYDQRRGEPRANVLRAPLSRLAGPAGQAAPAAPAAPAAQALPAAGACVDCGLCVQVCPAGIDIRQGAQYECISCGLCIDACDRVMLSARQPTGLIRFANSLGTGWRDTLAQARVRGHALALLLALLGVGWTVAQRVPLQLEVLRDRAVLSRPNRDGSVDNVYRLHLQNYDVRAHAFTVQLREAGPLQLLPTAPIDVPASGERSVAVTVRLPAAAAAEAQGASTPVLPLQLAVVAEQAPALQRQQATRFLLPR
ncbi:cytochrome c oxidase accessory protein CcoG [Curvibacter sp. HBC61]|uniref:Cytochrome c oxidase accessory protein CcoG n=1 Tax=Curvibacter cyanobacteriorum TaxID=3026422 RepID=A0ABT5N3J4_9BURK|nr:cytochrome c oxidase accessory protein CcoG [Curvibacter sp. HBC61]MDD0840889.1 cytochrome c oxidase accessory protein CcoG [Curvibacter sp. HBC61]